ncbi:TPR domain protein [Fimbriiglobus ruber]|uniref:TPR domain protein n=1 Tax=Fimbriiglobus ruber TaxID=1908690 RepID=A0A225DBI6_9BACT|nr:TPR domain protein [Fimbriiglobus ruber]
MLLGLLFPAIAGAADSVPERVPAAPLTDAEAARRDALTRYGVGVLRGRNDLPVRAMKEFEAAAKADPTAAAPPRELVKLYANFGRDAAAIRAARTVLDLDPTDADTGQTLGRLLFEAKKFAEAAAVLGRAADSPRLATAPARRLGILQDQARALEKAADWAGAETTLRAAVQLASGQRDELLKSTTFPTPADLGREIGATQEHLGQSLVEQKKFPQAVEAFMTAARTFAENGDATGAARVHWNLSGALAANGNPSDALASLEKFIAFKPSGPRAYERYAELMREIGRGAVISDSLTRLATENSKNEAIRWVMAAELGKDNPAAGARSFRELADTTADPQFYRIMAGFYKTANRPDILLSLADHMYQAARGGHSDNKPPPTRTPTGLRATERARAFTAAVRAEPGLSAQIIRQATADLGAQVARSADSWELVASLAERDGRLDTAEAALWRAIRGGVLELPGSKDGESDLFSRLYGILYRQRKWNQIIELCLAAESVAANPRKQAGGGQRSYEYYRIMPLAELNRGTEALATIERFIPNAVNSRAAQLQKARVLIVLDRHAEAIALAEGLLADALKQGPASEAHDIRFVLSEAHLGLKEFTKAEAELRAILDDDPDDVQALNNLGYNLADQGRNLAEAEEMIRRAIDLNRDERVRAGNPEADYGTYLDSLGWVLFRRGRVADARTVMEKVVRLPDSSADATVWDHLGDVRFRAGDRAAARQAWEKAAVLYENSHVGRQNDRRVEVLRKLKSAE